MKRNLMALAVLAQLLAACQTPAPIAQPTLGGTATEDRVALQTAALPSPPTLAPATRTPVSECPRTVFPSQAQSSLLFAPFAPGLEWRTLFDTHYPVQNSQKVYIRAAISEPTTGTVTATLRGSQPPVQLSSTLSPTYPSDEHGWPGDPPGTIRLIGGIELPKAGCWDFHFQVKDLEGYVIVQAL